MANPARFGHVTSDTPMSADPVSQLKGPLSFTIIPSLPGGCPHPNLDMGPEIGVSTMKQ